MRECLVRIPRRLILFALALLERTHHQRLVVLFAPLGACTTSDPCLVYLDWEIAANAAAVWTHHGGTEFVQDLEGRRKRPANPP
jgi:hypothetical protein